MEQQHSHFTIEKQDRQESCVQITKIMLLTVRLMTQSVQVQKQLYELQLELFIIVIATSLMALKSDSVVKKEWLELEEYTHQDMLCKISEEVFMNLGEILLSNY